MDLLYVTNPPKRSYLKPFLLILSLFSAGVFIYSFSKPSPLYSNNTLDQAEFDHFTSTYSKTYSSDKDQRFLTFKQNSAFIRKQNQINTDWVLGINSFADTSFSEFKSKFFAPKPSKVPTAEEVKPSEGAIPDVVNWVEMGAVTPVGNQGNCNSHWAFSAVGAIESAWNISGNPLIQLSVQQVLDCSHSFGNWYCDGGLMDYAFKYVINNTGIASEASYPYKGKQTDCNQTLANMTVANITSYTNVKANNKTALMQAIAQQPVSVAVEADQVIWQFYKGGVISRNCGTVLDHGALAVGYDNTSTPPYYLVKNSQGTDWGENGYIRLAIVDGAGVCGIQMEPSYPNIK